MSERPQRLILGPQRPRVYIGDAMRRHGMDRGDIAVISAGWQEAEGDIDIIRHEVGQPMEDLHLYARSAELFAADPDLHAAYRERQDRLTEQQRMYRLRLKQLKIAVRQTLRAEGPPAVVAPERRHAVSQLRALDRHHQRQIDKAHARFDSEFNVDTSGALAEHVSALHDTLANVGTVIVTGGNLIVLMNRVRLFGLGGALAGKNIVGWSAGAMLLGERIVLFHDRMPQGRQDAEVIDEGLGLLGRFIVLPDAKHRLRTGNELRMSALSRRFSPTTCLLVNNGSAALFDDVRLVLHEHVSYPTMNGRIRPVATR